MGALKGHSLLFDAPEVAPEALFLEHREADGHLVSPEVFPRADGTVYACAISSESPLPDDPAGAAPDEGAIERLAAICRAVSPALAPERIVARAACWRPVTRERGGHSGASCSTWPAGLVQLTTDGFGAYLEATGRPRLRRGLRPPHQALWRAYGHEGP